MTTAITIHAALPEEAERLTEIAFASKRHWQYPETWIELWADELTVSEAYIRSHAVYKACLADDVVGWYALDCGPEVWEIDYFWVRPDMIMTGVGSAMLGHARAHFEASGADLLKVISDPNAAAFYRKMGFKPAGKHPSKPKGRFLPMLLLEKMSNRKRF